MKKVLYIWIALLCGIGHAFSQSSQTPVEKLTRNVLAVVEINEIVNPGEFQMELKKGEFFDALTDNPWFTFVYTTTNRYTGFNNIVVNGRLKVVSQEMNVRTYRIGPGFESGIFVIKNTGAYSKDLGIGMELVMACGVAQSVCDSVLYVNDDGFVCLRDGNCFYNQYKSVSENHVQVEKVVWPQRKTYESGVKYDDPVKSIFFEKLTPGDVYYESSEGHYYYLYRDQYMPNTVLVVDNVPVELFDVYDEESLRLKFSYNGKHWMAVGKECFWINGQLKSVAGYDIADFVITNDGHYAYAAVEKSNSKRNAVVIYDGHVIRRNADVCYFGLNAQGSLKIRFTSGDRYLQYENEKITDVTAMMESVFYPGKEDGRTFQVLSGDGQHKLTYHRGIPSVEIDGFKVADSEPCYAIFDERNNAFVWNAIESRDMKTELVIYRCPVVNKFFKNLFK